MPTVLRIDGFRFFFYANEGQEPAHIHVANAENVAKFWLSPVRLAGAEGFQAKTINQLIGMVRDNEDLFIRHWNEFFGKGEKEEEKQK